MRKRSTFATLLAHFFHNFFENDLIQSNGDMVTTIVRALSIVASPGLMLAFFLQNQYPRRPAWGRIEDHYFFVLYSMLSMAGVAIFEWEMLFPGRLDFLVLSPLPLRGRVMLGAKAGALGLFLSLFLAASNVFGAFMLPMVSKEHLWRQIGAHLLAATCSGVFGAFAVMAAGGVLLCILPSGAFKRISPVLQMIATMMLGLLLVHYVCFGDSLDEALGTPFGRALYIPSFWYLGMYERLLRGSSAADFALPMMKLGLWAIGIALATVAITYPLAWVRMRRMAIEGEGGPRKGHSPLFINWLIAHAVPLSAQRAVFHFIGQTIARNSRYQVYLAMYSGTGLALAIACAGTFVNRSGQLHPVVSIQGLHAVMPLLLFWVVVGLRMAFGLPMNLPARWVFRITGAPREACVSTSRIWTLLCGLTMLVFLLPVLSLGGFRARELLVQGVCGVVLCVLMVESLLFADRGIPFAQPRSPGKENLPLLLTLFIGVLPVFCIGMVRAEMWLEHKLRWLPVLILTVPILYAVSGYLRRRSQAQLEDGDEIESEFQLLGLGTE